MYVDVQAVLIITAKLIKCSLSLVSSLFSSLFVSILSTTFPLSFLPPSPSYVCTSSLSPPLQLVRTGIQTSLWVTTNPMVTPIKPLTTSRPRLPGCTSMKASGRGGGREWERSYIHIYIMYTVELNKFYYTCILYCTWQSWVFSFYSAHVHVCMWHTHVHVNLRLNRKKFQLSFLSSLSSLFLGYHWPIPLLIRILTETAA